MPAELQVAFHVEEAPLAVRPYVPSAEIATPVDVARADSVCAGGSDEDSRRPARVS